MLGYISYISASLAGLILFGIGAIGLSGAPHQVSPAVTMLLQTSGWDAEIETAYYITLIALGIWLVLHIYVRSAAMVALILILAKIIAT
jgi:hypothetical protein